MKLISGKPYWPAHNPPAPKYPSLARHISCEIAVIGGGYTGALIGYALTADGADVLLVDRRDFGTGSTGWAILRDLYRGKRNPDRHLFRFDRPGASTTSR